MDPWLTGLTLLLAAGCAVARLTASERAPIPEDGRADHLVALGRRRLADADLHLRAFVQGEHAFDARRARELADEAVRLIDEACDRLPDRQRPAAWQEARGLARAVRARVEATLEG